jgi:hypothetical protein
MVIADPAGVTAKAGQLQRFLDSYSALFKQLAAAPEKRPATSKSARSRDK